MASETNTKIVISADDRTKAAFLSVQNSLVAMTRSIAVLAGAGSLGAMFKSVVDNGDQLAKLNERTGVSVEKLSEFAHGAKLANISTQDMATGLQKLAQNMAEAASNRGSQAAQVFTALGISVQNANGRLKSTAQVFEELSAKFAGAADGAEKVAIARSLLGKTGDILIPMMNQLAQSSQEARRLGLIVSDEFARSAQRFNDSIGLMESRLASFMRKSLTPYIEMMNRVFNSFSDDLPGIQQRRMEVTVEMQRMLNEGTPKSHPQIQALIKQIDDLDAKIIAANKKLLATGNANPNKKPLPGIRNVGQEEIFKRLIADLQIETSKSQLTLVKDEQDAANRRVAIAMAEALKKADFEKMSVEQRKKYIEAFNEFAAAKTAEEMHKAQTPMEKLNEEWQDIAQQMQQATVKWAQGATDALTEFVMTGKFSFRDFADSIVRDLVRIFIQKQITGPLFTSMESGGVFSDIGRILSFAHGGSPPVGVPSLVGERGPELFVPRTAGTIVPNRELSGIGGPTIYIDARGADQSGFENLKQMVLSINGSIEKRAIGAVVDAKRRGMMPA